jgi:hypothetical protein
VFFAYTSAATPRGPEECFCTVSFNDRSAPLKNPADAKPCSCVSVYLYRRLNNVTEKVPVTERFPVGHSEFFEPLCIHGGEKWRRLAVEGTAKEFRIFWEGHLLCTVPTTELSQALLMMRSLPGHEQFDQEASHEFAPSGGLGLFLSHSQASCQRHLRLVRNQPERLDREPRGQHRRRLAAECAAHERDLEHDVDQRAFDVDRPCLERRHGDRDLLKWKLY